MLNRREWARLSEIETALVAEDPELARQFDRFGAAPEDDTLGPTVLFALVAVLGVLSAASLAVGVVAVAVPVAMLAMAVALAGVFMGGPRRSG